MEVNLQNIKMERYPEYKDSGVEWLGEIPNHWDQTRVKFQLTYQKGKNPKDFVSEETDWVYLSMEYLRSNQPKIQYIKNIKGCVFVDDDEILLLWDGSNAGEFIRSKKGVLSSTMALITILNADQNYAWHYLKVIEIQLRESTIGMGIPHVSSDELKNLLFLLPPPEEQTRIAHFLDQKTAQIDQAIAQKERLNELLKERRQILIHNAVTRGLDPNVKMKDSGVEWIGEVPEGWEVKRLKFLTNYFKGFAFSSGDFVDSGIPIVKASNIKNWQVENISSYIALLNQKKRFERFKLLEGDIIISTVGSKPEIKDSAVGQLAMIDKDFEFSYLNQNTVCIRPNKEIYRGFLKYTFISNYMRSNLDSISLWIANQAYLEVDSILEIYVTLPSLSEQIAISKYIETVDQKIVAAITCKQAEIEKLKEYKATLINSVVTGKIKIG